MRKFIILILSSTLLFSRVVLADNSNRIEELQEEAKTLIERRTEYVQVINNIDVRLLQINAVVAELKRLDGTLEIKKEEVDE